MSACCLTVWAKSDTGFCIEDKAAGSHGSTEHGLPGVHDVGCLLTAACLPPTLESMDVQLSADQRAFFRLALETGRLNREEDAVEEALRMWEERERARAEIIAMVESADASLGHGQGRVITQESMRELAGDVKQRGRARLAAEQLANR